MREVTCILNVYRRPQYLRAQIEALLNQTIKPKDIFIWINNHEDNETLDLSSLSDYKVFKNNFNWKYHGRFSSALLARTEYIAIFDDDTIPGTKWLESCLNNIDSHNGIMGTAGIILDDFGYSKHTRCGWPTRNEELTEVDLVGHSWVFKKEWLKYFWIEEPYTWENGEDIQFSYLAKKYGNIKTFCPPHPRSNMEIHGSIAGHALGSDSKASYINYGSEFYKQRDECVRHYVRNGWETVRRISEK
jgi:hypothetical protein